MDVHPVRRVRHIVSAPHTPRSVPRLPWSSSLFVPWKCQALTDPFGSEMQARASKAHSLPRCLTASLSRSLPHRRAASPPRCVAASSVRPSVRPSVRSSVPASLSLPLSLTPSLVPSLPPFIPPSVPLSLTRSIACSLLHLSDAQPGSCGDRTQSTGADTASDRAVAPVHDGREQEGVLCVEGLGMVLHGSVSNEDARGPHARHGETATRTHSEAASRHLGRDGAPADYSRGDVHPRPRNCGHGRSRPPACRRSASRTGRGKASMARGQAKVKGGLAGTLDRRQAVPRLRGQCSCTTSESPCTKLNSQYVGLHPCRWVVC